MYRLAIFFLMTSLSAAHALDLSSLRKPGVIWHVKSAQTADVNCDGRPDTILLGTARNRVWAAIIPGGGGKPQTMEFPVAPGFQSGFCGVPKRINIEPLSCSSEDGPLDGSKPVRSCKAFSLDDGECDPFNFYWDSRHKRMRWWRN
jgi:hypothetical protein